MTTINYGAKAVSQEEQARKALKWKFLDVTTWFDTNARQQDAFVLFEQAASNYKLAGERENSGDCYAECVSLCEQNTDLGFRMPEMCIKASNEYEKCDITKALIYLNKAISAYLDLGKLDMAAKYYEKHGDLMLTSDTPSNAIVSWLSAVKTYNADDKQIPRNTCLVKIARQEALNQHYEQAIEAYEQIIGSDIRVIQMDTFMYESLLCYLCLGNYSNAQTTLNKYITHHPQFENDRKGKFINQLILCLQNDDMESLVNTIYDYDSTTKLDPWATTILLRIKTTCLSNQDNDSPC